MSVRAVIFDLDGVIISTDEFHYRAWSRMANEEEIEFDRDINDRLRGVSRMESLEIILERAQKPYTPEERLALAARKNGYYRELLGELTPNHLLSGASALLAELRRRGILLAIGSSSKNAPFVLERIGLGRYFDATVDGNDIRNSKPDPEVFLLAAKRLGVNPRECAVVEDATTGLDAAISGGMKPVGIGSAAMDPRASYAARDVAAISVDELLS
jgi:beta-phosphoglucomutase